MLTVLAVDTATETCSVALARADGTIERSEHVGSGHSDRVLPMVDDVLAEAGIGLDAVDVIAFGAGPGSFTGLRIACGVAQGLAWAATKRVVAVGNLRAIALRAFLEEPRATVVLAAIDARMGEAYCAIYRRDDDIREIRAPSLETPSLLPQLASEFGVNAIAGNALAIFPGISTPRGAWIGLPSIAASARDIAALGCVDAAAGLTIEPELALPLYVRDRVAMTIDERAERRAAATGAT